MTLSTYMDKKKNNFEIWDKSCENLLELYGNIKEPYPWGQGHYIHICNKKW